ncbi:hypothetical protein SLEP1_g31130 [Rubroshorea leprosula]|uniref:Uncharacterized protein n=1 Tax=Rubroshorea leprosula TaxID=152421 RepID=A0AAV5K4S4_9ROSI|nr:hypothetical protein SLEP1_g31130 [Rubroshorea leprosula]
MPRTSNAFQALSNVLKTIYAFTSEFRSVFEGHHLWSPGLWQGQQFLLPRSQCLPQFPLYWDWMLPANLML